MGGSGGWLGTGSEDEEWKESDGTLLSIYQSSTACWYDIFVLSQ